MPFNCIDVSNWTGEITAAQASALRADGITHAIVGTQYPRQPSAAGYPPGVAHQQIPALLGAGIAVDAYVYLYAGIQASIQVVNALKVIAPWKNSVGRLWIDCEDEAFTKGERTIEAIRQALRACGQTPAGIYTGRWWWTAWAANTGEFSAGWPLWAAQYDGIPNADVFASFGGWPRCMIKQFAGSGTLSPLHGIMQYDANHYQGATVTAGTTATEDRMARLDKRIKGLEDQLYELSRRRHKHSTRFFGATEAATV